MSSAIFLTERSIVLAMMHHMTCMLILQDIIISCGGAYTCATTPHLQSLQGSAIYPGCLYACTRT